MSLATMQYLEVNLLGVMILLIMQFFIVQLQRDFNRPEQKIFIRMIICNVVTLVTDCGITLLDGHDTATLVQLHYIICIVYYAFHGFFGYLWMVYCVRRLFPDYKPGKALFLLAQIPWFINLALTVTSPWTGIIFRIVENNTYERGSYMWLTIGLTYLYWLIGAGITIREIIHSTRLREHSLYITLLFFPIPVIIGIILQMPLYGLSVVWLCTALSLLTLFINIQNYQLSHDIMTGLFNRRQANVHIDHEIRNLPNRDDCLFAIMIDLDYFKNINDKYGHLSGDKALISVADILRQSFRKKDFIGRFGGDEFLVVGHVQTAEEVSMLIAGLQKNLAQRNNQPNISFPITLSAGASVYSKNDLLTFDRIISAADNEMYKVKKNRG